MAQELSKDPVFDGVGYEPSLYSRSQFVPAKTDYDFTVYENANHDKNKKILVVCTEEKYLTMANGKKFSTGNHPVETFVPLLHFEAAGFEAEIYTPTGRPVQLEMWAMPAEDEAVKGIVAKYKHQLEAPKSLHAFVAHKMKTDVEYVAVYIPGGHGALIGLPSNTDLKEIIHWVLKEDKYLMALCHGPAGLLAGAVNEKPENYPYKGYKIISFPDEIDKQLPSIGYVPGDLPWFYGEKLRALGVDILNHNISGACHTDRKLVTGDSPLAANAFGKMGANVLLSGK
ncbi:MAG: DJ-1/PfpI family protein [Marinifilaceae bacterium]